VVVRGCRSLDSLVPKPDPCSKEFDCLSRSYEWRLNMLTGEIEKDEGIKMEYHMFDKNTYCNGAAFVARDGGVEEDDVSPRERLPPNNHA
ncbi:hypothetical protein RYX36_028744, partial [Vicia faba]